MYRNLWCCCVALAACSAVRADDPPKVVRERISGACRFPGDEYLRIRGIPRVIDAHTLAFDDGTVVELNGGMDAPDLEQFGLIGDVLYPCGREAAEFLQKLIGDRTVVCYVENEDSAKPRADCYIGETRVETEMVRNAWAVSDHSGTESWEIIARENKRGLWRGTFVEMGKWRKGKGCRASLPPRVPIRRRPSSECGMRLTITRV
jgi:endonuclease YncB( thermonuclease family)